MEIGLLVFALLYTSVAGQPTQIGQSCADAGFCMIRNSECFNGTICQCREGFRTINKYHCTLERKRLGETCISDEHCLAAFSTCRGEADAKVCECLDGFSPNSNSSTCLPEVYKCPHGEAFRNNDGSIRFCTPHWNRNASKCPSDHFCVALETHHYRNNAMLGHCCPEDNVDPFCFYGEPKPLESSSCSEECPIDTHFCEGNSCCPKPCQSKEDIFHEGKCYPTAALGAECSINDQCETSGAFCMGMDGVESKVCACQAGKALWRGRCIEPYCPTYSGWAYIYDPDGKKVTCTDESENKPCVEEGYCIYGACCKFPKVKTECSEGHKPVPDTKCSQYFPRIRCQDPAHVCSGNVGVCCEPEEEFRKKLGEECTSDGQSSASFSFCNESGICACISDDYQQVGPDQCKPKKVSHCPIGEVVLDENKKARQCRTGHRREKSKSCPSNSYCATLSGFSVGFCCQTSFCPYGEAHPNATCAYDGTEGQVYCPYNTHQCWRNSYFKDTAFCCPKPCKVYSDIFMNGTCFPGEVQLGESCVMDEQCYGGSKCRNVAGKKQCGCRDEQIEWEGRCATPHCYDKDWKQKLLPNGKPMTCSSSQDKSCGSDAHCHNGICCSFPENATYTPCPRGYMPVNDTKCSNWAPQIRCLSDGKEMAMCSGRPGFCCREDKRPEFACPVGMKPAVGDDGLAQTCDVRERFMAGTCPDEYRCVNSLVRRGKRYFGNCCQIERKVLGEVCNNSLECVTPYSHCKVDNGTGIGVCSCDVDNFKQENDSCVPNPENFHCVKGEPLKDGDENIQLCRMGMKLLPRMEEDRDWSSCPDNYTCVLQPSREPMLQIEWSGGHCCPMIPREKGGRPYKMPRESTHVCPYGESIPINGHCFAKDNQCPSESHECKGFWYKFRVHDSSCCPKARPCMSADEVYAEGKCWHRKLIGEPCQVEEECQGVGAICKGSQDEKQCACKDGQVSHIGICAEPSCKPPYFATRMARRFRIRIETIANMSFPEPMTDDDGKVMSCSVNASSIDIRFLTGQMALAEAECGENAYCDLGTCCPLPSGDPAPCADKLEEVKGSNCSSHFPGVGCGVGTKCSGRPGVCCKGDFGPSKGLRGPYKYKDQGH